MLMSLQRTKHRDVIDQILADSKKNVIEFIEDIRDNILNSTNFSSQMDLARILFERMSDSVLMGHVIKYVLPHAENIKERQLVFFDENKYEIFRGLSTEDVDAVTEIIKNLDEYNINIVWAYFDNMVRLAKKYKKDQ